MRSIQAALLFACCLCADARAFCQEPEEQAFEALYGIAFVDARTGWAVGRNSLILHTADGGATWEVQHRNVGVEERELLAVDFAEAKRGVAVGRKGLILRTEDGGESWVPAARVRTHHWRWTQAQLAEAEAALQSMERARDECLDTPRDDCEPEACCAAIEAEIEAAEVERAAILESLADEHRWLEPPAAVAEIDFRDILYVDAQVAYCVSSQGLLRSADGGKTWDWLEPPYGGLPRAAHFLDADRGWIAGDGGEVHRTDDGGQTWERLSLDEPWRLSAVFFLDEEHGWVGGESGLVMATDDGGRSWKRLDNWSDREVREIQFTSPDSGAFATWDGGALWTGDGGTIWTEIALPEDAAGSEMTDGEQIPEPLAVTFVDDELGYAVGTWGLVLVTRDGGASWDVLRSSYQREADALEELRSIDTARFGFNVDMGYVHPVGKIADRYGPGMYLGMDFLGLRGWFKIGAGYDMKLMSTNEKIVAPPGEIREDEAVELKKSGVLFYVPILAQLSLWERGSWMLRGIIGVGFIYHGMMLSDAHASAVDEDSNYGRSRIGVGLNQSLIFGWMYAYRARNNPGEIVRGGIYLKAGIQESWTWDVDQVQTDLGKHDDREFGTELWPFVVIGLSLFE